MHPAQIKAALEMAGHTQASIARSVTGRSGGAVSSAAVHHVVRGLSQSRVIALRISEVTGLTVAELWPGRYPQLEAQQARSTRRASSTQPVSPRKAA
jgi:lambda repressor-like predicted transcriptional regulator